MSDKCLETLITSLLAEKDVWWHFDFPGEQRQRLLEMGLTAGVEFQIVRYAPLGDPIELKVRGYHLSLRKQDAAGVRVELIS